MDKKYEIDTKLGLVDYAVVVEDIAKEYFDELGNYVPHFGRLNAMRNFYNHCVKDSPFEGIINHDLTDAMKMEALVADDAFYTEYCQAIQDTSIALSFGNAYKNALAIVEDKKGSIRRVIDYVGAALPKVVELFQNGIVDDYLNKASTFVEEFKSRNTESGNEPTPKSDKDKVINIEEAKQPNTPAIAEAKPKGKRKKE